MALSGIKVDPDALEKYHQLKIRKEFGYLLLKIQNDKIVIFESGKKGSSAKDFSSALQKQKDCCFGVFDGSKVALFTWNPDSAPAKSKMLMASSADALRSSFEGVGQAINVTDVDELNEKLKEKNII